MAPSRRIGTEQSKTRALLIDATERLMLEEGYAAVSSRRVAAVAGVKPALVHYYFPTMDDLFLAVFRRGAERNLKRFSRAAGSDRPLRALWKLNRDPRGSVLVMEFTALSRHRKVVRAALGEYAEKFRRLQLEAVRRVFDERGIEADGIDPEALVVLLTAVSTTLVLEREIGVSTGHREANRLVEDLLDRFEPAKTKATSRSR
jgi:AcrR family transcriptional regulator